MKKPCPHCKQYTLQSSKFGGCFVIVLSLGTVFFFMFIPPLLLISIVLFVIGIVMLFAPTTYQCLNCHFTATKITK
jgi:hypothetical protein